MCVPCPKVVIRQALEKLLSELVNDIEAPIDPVKNSILKLQVNRTVIPPGVLHAGKPPPAPYPLLTIDHEPPPDLINIVGANVSIVLDLLDGVFKH